MHFISEELEAYVNAHCSAQSDLLNQLEKETYQKVLQPRMISGFFQGRFLGMLSKLIKPKTILELGTYTGFSTLCLAEGLPEDGQIFTIDIKDELVDFQKKYFEASPYNHQIHSFLGSALAIIPTLNTTYDLVFIDADKNNYLNYFHLIMPLMNPGGVILSDNVLWSGKILEPTKPNDQDTLVLKEYNQLLANDPRLETVLLPIRDGITISRVK